MLLGWLIVLEGFKVDKQFMGATAVLGLTSMTRGAALRLCRMFLGLFLTYVIVQGDFVGQAMRWYVDMRFPLPART